MVTVQFTWQRRPSQPAARALRQMLGEALGRLGVSASEVHVLVTDDRRMRELNRRFRHQDCATDVLSFPDGVQMPTGSVLLGQVVLSLDAARRQAKEMGHDELRELQELLLHGTLHLLGYDHARDGGEMNELELRLREEALP